MTQAEVQIMDRTLGEAHQAGPNAQAERDQLKRFMDALIECEHFHEWCSSAFLSGIMLGQQIPMGVIANCVGMGIWLGYRCGLAVAEVRQLEGIPGVGGGEA